MKKLRLIFRFNQIGYAFIKCMIIYFLSKDTEKIRIKVENLGFTFIKLGQILSTREDILDKRICTSLRSLLDDTAPISFQYIKDTLEKEAIFDKLLSIDEVPLASASVSQIHKAVLLNGDVVAIKVKKPNLDKTLEVDLKCLNLILWIASVFSKKIKYILNLGLVSQIEGWMRQELDFNNECLSSKQLREYFDFCNGKNYEGLGTGKFVLMYEEYCTDNILVMEYLDGATINRLDSMGNIDEYEPIKNITVFLRAAFHGIFYKETYIYQGDPHAANIMFTKDGQYTSLDCGLTFRLTKYQTLELRKLICLLYLRDADNLMQFFKKKWGINIEALGSQFYYDITKYMNRISDESIGYWFFEMVKIFIEYRLDFPKYLIEFGRCVFIMDGTIKLVSKDLSALDILEEEFKNGLIQNVKSAFTAEKVIEKLYLLMA